MGGGRQATATSRVVSSNRQVIIICLLCLYHLYCDLNIILMVDANLQLEEVLEAQGSQIDIVGDDDLNDSPHRYAHGVSETHDTLNRCCLLQCFNL